MWLHSGEQFSIGLLYHCKGQAESAQFLSLLLLPSVSPPDVLGQSLPGASLILSPSLLPTPAAAGPGKDPQLLTSELRASILD